MERPSPNILLPRPPALLSLESPSSDDDDDDEEALSLRKLARESDRSDPDIIIIIEEEGGEGEGEEKTSIELTEMEVVFAMGDDVDVLSGVGGVTNGEEHSAGRKRMMGRAGKEEEMEGARILIAFDDRFVGESIGVAARVVAAGGAAAASN